MTDTKKKKNIKKELLVNLVANCKLDPALITLELSRAGLLKQYEKELKEQNVKPTLMSLDEFDKIMKGE